MKELFKARITQAVNRVVGKETGTVDKELMSDYIDSMVDTTCRIFDALSGMYDDEESMKKSIDEFVDVNFKDKTEGIRHKNYKTDSYMLATIPILLPIEAIAILDGLDDLALPLIMRQLSSLLLYSILELREYDKLGDKMLERDKIKLADHLKNKGWVA